MLEEQADVSIPAMKVWLCADDISIEDKTNGESKDLHSGKPELFRFCCCCCRTGAMMKALCVA
jgi:hypothetical protein